MDEEEEMRIEHNITVSRHICGQALDEEYDEVREKLLVTPCDRCMDKAKDEARDEGRDEGIAEGIRECEGTH
jgi:hypothetical protein